MTSVRRKVVLRRRVADAVRPVSCSHGLAALRQVRPIPTRCCPPRTFCGRWIAPRFRLVDHRQKVRRQVGRGYADHTYLGLYSGRSAATHGASRCRTLASRMAGRGRKAFDGRSRSVFARYHRPRLACAAWRRAPVWCIGVASAAGSEPTQEWRIDQVGPPDLQRTRRFRRLWKRHREVTTTPFRRLEVPIE